MVFPDFHIAAVLFSCSLLLAGLLLRVRAR